MQARRSLQRLPLVHFSIRIVGCHLNRLTKIAGSIAVAVLLLALGLFTARGQGDPLSGASANATLNTNVDDPGAPLKDSLSERGSHNFHDIGSWIWDTNVCDRQTVRFWQTFTVPDGVRVYGARLRLTADNEYILYLDGRELGRDAEWRHLYEYDIADLIGPGSHVLAVEAYNSSREAGFLLGLQVGLSSGGVVKIKSDSSWWIPPLSDSDWMNRTEPVDGWRHAVVEAGFGQQPWGYMDFINLVPRMQPVLVHFWQTVWFEVVLVLVCVVVSILSFFLAAQVLLHSKERQLILRERARIARDIHDDLGTRVTQLVLHGEVAQNELPANSRTRGQLERISEDAREALRAMDEILWAINPRRDTLHEFATFVCGQAQAHLKAAGIQCVLDVEPGMSSVAFDLPFRRNLLMAVKEAVNNAVKHSGGTEVLLSIRRHGHGLIVAVQDNGRGFEAAQAKSDRHGLDNMRERLREVGGYCVLTSQPGRGCRIEFHVPKVQMSRRFWWQRWQTSQPSVGAPNIAAATTKS
jgi:signal transduction histidine kinase